MSRAAMSRAAAISRPATDRAPPGQRGRCRCRGGASPPRARGSSPRRGLTCNRARRRRPAASCPRPGPWPAEMRMCRIRLTARSVEPSCCLPRAHIQPDDPAGLVRGVRPHPNPVAERLRLARHVHAAPVRIERPSMVDTADGGALVPPEIQGRAAMRAVLLQQPHPPGTVPVGNQVLAQQPYPRGRPPARESPPSGKFTADERTVVGHYPPPARSLGSVGYAGWARASNV